MLRDLPPTARILWCVAALLACFALVGLVLWRPMPLPHPEMRLWELGLFILLGVAAGTKKVKLMPFLSKKVDKDAGSMSLGFAVIFAALLRFGPEGAVPVGIVSTLSSCLWPYRFAWYQTAYNLAVNILQTVSASLVLLALNNGTTQIHGWDSLPAIVASTLVFFFVNTGLVSAIIGLCTGTSVLGVWRETFLWTAPSYFLGSGFSSLATYLMGDHLMATLACAAPVAYFTHASYRSYMERANAALEGKERLAELYLATIRSLALAIDAKDQYTHQHIVRVQRYAVAIAQEMGLSGEDLKGIETAALLHDIGKLGVPEYVLLKPGPLTEEEFAKIKEHPRIGADILDPVEFPWPVLPGVKHHHEKWNGTGYPDGLKEEEIPLQGRILAVADVYDALTSTRSYRQAWDHTRAVEEISSKSAIHFDPRVVEAFLAVIDQVIEEMAQEGIGPKIRRDATPTSSASSSSSSPAAATTIAGTTRADEAVRDIQRAGAELWALYEVAQTLSASLGLQETLEILGRKLGAILPQTTCLFLLRRSRETPEAEPRLEVRAATGLLTDLFCNGRTLSTESLSERVAEQRSTYRGDFDPEDVQPEDARSGALVAALRTPPRSALIVPIIHQGEVLGTINVYSAEQGAFSIHDQHLLEIIAERTAMAIYNGMLFDRTRSHALTDPLTGLSNIRHLTEQLERRCGIAAAINEESGTSAGNATVRPFALLCIDLDSFKPINDNFGHQKGDEVLRDLSRLFQATLRPQDLVARYGGDEFVVVLDGSEHEDAQQAARRLADVVAHYDANLYHPRLGNLRLGASIGVACFPQDGTDTPTLLSVADRRMYEEKAVRKLRRMAPLPHAGLRPATRRSVLTDIPSFRLAVRRRVRRTRASSGPGLSQKEKEIP